MLRILATDHPPDLAADADPILHLTWVSSTGVKCETVLMGSVATAVARSHESVGITQGWPGIANLITLAEYRRDHSAWFDVDHFYVDTKILSYGDRLSRVLARFRQKVVQICGHGVRT
jgi:hypothetical protein